MEAKLLVLLLAGCLIPICLAYEVEKRGSDLVLHAIAGRTPSYNCGSCGSGCKDTCGTERFVYCCYRILRKRSGGLQSALASKSFADREEPLEPEDYFGRFARTLEDLKILRADCMYNNQQRDDFGFTIITCVKCRSPPGRVTQ